MPCRWQTSIQRSSRAKSNRYSPSLVGDVHELHRAALAADRGVERRGPDGGEHRVDAHLGRLADHPFQQPPVLLAEDLDAVEVGEAVAVHPLGVHDVELGERLRMHLHGNRRPEEHGAAPLGSDDDLDRQHAVGVLRRGDGEPHGSPSAEVGHDAVVRPEGPQQVGVEAGGVAQPAVVVGLERARGCTARGRRSRRRCAARTAADLDQDRAHLVERLRRGRPEGDLERHGLAGERAERGSGRHRPGRLVREHLLERVADDEGPPGPGLGHPRSSCSVSGLAIIQKHRPSRAPAVRE